MNLIRKSFRRLTHILGEYRIIPPKITSLLLHTLELNRIPNLRTPKDLNEKLMWLAFNTDTSVWSGLSDKYEMKKFLTERGYQNLVVPTLGIYEAVEDVEFDNLPSSFVIKSTNGSAQTILIKDKSNVDFNEIKTKMGKWLSRPFGYGTGETHYLAIPPRIIIEEMLPLIDDRLPVDYKFMCFNGHVHSCLVCSERDSRKFNCKLNLFDVLPWKEMENSVTPTFRGTNAMLDAPSKLEDMLRISSELSKGFPFVRIDFYETAGKIFIGELTFTPAGFRIPYLTQKTLLEMGSLLNPNLNVQ